MVVSCGLKDRGDLAWWAPHDGAVGQHPWLPSFLRLSTQPQEYRLRAVEAETAEELPPIAAVKSAVTAVYELTALVLHVRDEASAISESAAEQDEGHLLAHIKVHFKGFDGTQLLTRHNLISDCCCNSMPETYTVRCESP